jgi:hypothetical protein
MKPFIIRTAFIDDAKAIAECHKEAVETKAAAFYSANIINEWSWSLDRIEKILSEIQNRDFIYVVASLDDYILGYGIANPKALELKSLCTRPNKVGRVGASILAELLEQCKKQGCTYLDLSSSLNAEKFYLDNGFLALEKGRHILDSGLAMDCIKMRIEF